MGFINNFAGINSLYMFGGVMIGVILGAIPGLTCGTAIALIIPMTYYMNTESAMVLILSIFVGGIYGGSISSILLGTPGTPASAATAMDGFPMAKQGKSGKALEAALVASVIGTIFSAIILIFFTEPLANLAKMFGAKEYTVLILLALSVVGSVCGKSLARGLLSAFMGLWFSTIGLDPLTYASRYSFGNSYLMGGFEMVVVMIGLLAVSELFGQIEQLYRKTKNNANVRLLPPPTCRDDTRYTLADQKRCAKTTLRSCVLGCIVGILPAMGSAVASYMAYDYAKRGSRDPGSFGKGNIEGVVASEAANNAVCAGAMIPLLSFGIPGDATTAMMIGVFIIKGLYPGPTLFVKQPLLIYTIYAAFIAAGLVMWLEMKLAMSLFIKASRARMNVIFPCVIAACIVGSYVSRGNMMDPLVMMFFAFIGWLFGKFSFPSTPMLIGFILGKQFETYMRQALMSAGKIGFRTFFSTNICLILWGLLALSIISIIRSKMKSKMLQMSVE
jgi:putative tricarboxylic transport membrane protein